jgi:hypothetical protein
MLGPNISIRQCLNTKRSLRSAAWFLSPVLSLALLGLAAGLSSAQDKPEAGAAQPQARKADAQSKGMPLVFSDDFQQGSRRWETTDDTAWKLTQEGENQVFGLNRRISNYQPKYRSPHNIALIKDIVLSDFVLIYKVKSTNDTGGHRDCCTFFCHQDPSHFYYVHLGAVPDPHSGQIMIVNDAPRVALTDNKQKVAWDDKWHTVKVIRDSQSGTIEVYFDDMDTPHMSVIDKTFSKGRIGIGSFDDMNDFDDVKLYGM